MVNPVILGWIQVFLGLEDPYKNPKLFGMFLLFSTTIPNILSIPCFYYSGLDYVIHKKKEEAVIEAAFRAIKKAGELIDMSKHKGEHPRMGATDVCPLIPIANISMEETAKYAQQLAKRVGEELNLPVYLYEAAQSNKERSNLSIIRAGEYEGFAKKILLPEWKPDFGPAAFDVKRGATVIGARDFLVAYNINLNTPSTRRANAVAFDIREAGRVKRENGKIVNDANGNQ
jgi:glutamate formiminotransferase/formiminotetrahydrofolate cyclodeaminase